MTWTRQRSAHLAVGGICGLAWAAAMRAYMSELAGFSSRVEWAGTFGAILAPGAVCGAVLGLGIALRSERDRRARWCALAPLAIAAGPLLLPGALVALVTTGLGGGATAFTVLALAGGYALAGGGARWLRLGLGILTVGLIAGITATVPTVGGAPLTQPRGAWVATLVATLSAVLVLATAAPLRRRLEPRE